ncbi:glycosyltransferase [Thermospira aquatica]|uniref:Glycosyltransferase n=1 Tax=Thermospira aquatica TaxID=2828656 RepID=A0AAX3BG36_9SPIR|nr:glycosyltransferase [Thermospira aquatica]URA11140.1 glycosyltransferase [Thermospira aquatica]
MIKWDPFSFDGTLLVNLFFLAISLVNVIFLRLTTKPRKPSSFPKISVLIPARNEAHRIRPCLESLLSQDYPNYEVIVLNDNSTDDTEAILKEFSGKPNFRFINGKPLPPDWKGKPYASQQLFEAATGEILFFTDADTVHHPQTLSFLLGAMQHWGVDFLSGFALHETHSIGEKLILPAVYMATVLYLPLPLVLWTRWPFFSFAIGQILFMKRGVLEKINGFELVKNHVVEDLALAYTVKRHGFHTLFLDAKNFIRCRMYESFEHGFYGIARVIYAAIGKNFLLFLGLLIGIISAILLPAFFGIRYGFYPASELSKAWLCIGVFLTAWGIFLLDRRQSWLSIVGYPFVFFNLLLAALYSLVKTGLGKGILWKERLVK